MNEEKRRKTDTFFRQYVLPALIGVGATASVGAFNLAWNLSRDVEIIKAQRAVRSEEFAVAQAKIEMLEREIERLREWMKNHANRTGGTPSLAYEPPPAAPEIR